MWLLLLLSEKPMYGYELIRELEKRFSGYWKPQTGTIYPALDKLEQNQLVISQKEFRESGPDRKHYALTDKGQVELLQAMAYWNKVMGVVETYREAHQALFRQKQQTTLKQVAKFFAGIADTLKEGEINVSGFHSSQEEVLVKVNEPLTFKILYGKENGKLEIHMEIEWVREEP